MIEMNMINESIDILWKDEDETKEEDDKRLENLRRSGSSEKGGR
jgi:hypothetical protein